MRKLQWMVIALLAAWGLGLTAGLLADGPACTGHDGDEPSLGMAPDDGPVMLAMGGGPDGPGGPGDDHGPGMGPGGGRMMQALGLSQDQKDQLKALRRAHRGKMQAAQNALQDAREDQRELMEKGTATDAQLTAKHAEVMKLQQAVEELRFKSMLEARAILTPEQRKKALELMKQGRGRRMGRRMGGGPRGDGGPDGKDGKDGGQGGQDGPGSQAPKGGAHGADGDEG